MSADTISHFLDTFGYLAVFLFIAIENLGVPFPGETMLVVAAVYASQSKLQIPFVILACILGSVVGSTAGYTIGWHGGRGLIRRYGHYVRVSEKTLAPAERYFQRFGSATVFFGRFLAVLRAWAAFLAGMNKMPVPIFLIYNTAGAVIWSIVFGLLGFYLGKNKSQLQGVLTALGTGGVVIIVLLVLIGIFFYIRHRRARARAEVATLRPDEEISAG